MSETTVSEMHNADTSELEDLRAEIARLREELEEARRGPQRKRLAEAAEFAQSLSQESDVFHVVNLIAPPATSDIRSRSGRGRESEVQSLVALVCEIDTDRGQHKETDYPSQAVALEALARMPIRPSMVNLSGQSDGGLHVYWALRKPVPLVDETARETAKSISRQWQERLRSLLGSYRIDSTFDLVRVLRVAGCRNHKYANVVTRPLLVEERRYRLDEFARYCEPLERAGRTDRLAVDAVPTADHGRLQRMRRSMTLDTPLDEDAKQSRNAIIASSNHGK